MPRETLGKTIHAQHPRVRLPPKLHLLERLGRHHSTPPYEYQAFSPDGGRAHQLLSTVYCLLSTFFLYEARTVVLMLPRTLKSPSISTASGSQARTKSSRMMLTTCSWKTFTSRNELT